jgi:CheY-like chemotaxis protein
MRLARWTRSENGNEPASTVGTHAPAKGDATDGVVSVLHIDDDEDEFRLLRAAVRDIRGARYEVEWVSTYDRGLAAMTSNRHDVYLVDYNLAGRSGVELIRAARAAGCDRPMIMLTGQGSDAVDQAALDAGATDFVEKGRAAAGVLQRTLRYALSQAAITDALRRSLRQVSGLEALGRLLSEQGPTPDALDEVVRLIDEDFGLPRSTLFLMEDGLLQLAASRGYAAPVATVDPRSGRLVPMVTAGRAQIVPNLSIDPSDRSPDDPPELCVPLLAEGECLGILNVALPQQNGQSQELTGPIRVIADRLAVALALNRAIRGRSFIAPVTQPGR